MKNKKNGGNIPPVLDKRVLYVPVGCGRCMECRKQRGRNWQVRLHEEVKVNTNGKFVTLTFNENSLSELIDVIENITPLTGYDLDNEIATVGMRRFLERWRKSTGKSVRHWFITELGQTNTERVHLHGILFTDKDEEFIKDRWKYGHVYIGEFVNEKTVNYIVKYVSKTDRLHPNYTSKVLCSHGIGKNFVTSYNSERNRFNGDNTKETYVTRTGIKLGLPTYYRNHIYNEDEREKLWLQKLDKQERYVLGVKYDVSESEDDYENALKHAQTINTRLGYDKDGKNWEMKRYRNMKARLRMYQKQKR